MKIKEVINPNKIFGYGQPSHDPREWTENNNGVIYSAACSKPADATIITDCGWIISVRVICGMFVIKGENDGWDITAEKVLRNTASPECCVNAFERELKRIENFGFSHIKCRRLSEELSIKDLSEMTGISEELIEKLESGGEDIKKQSYEIVKKLADALQCKPQDIA